MKNKKSISFLFVLLFLTTTIYAQNGQLQPIPEGQKVLKTNKARKPGKVGSKNKMTPEQKKALKVKQIKTRQQRQSARKNKTNNRATAKPLNPNATKNKNGQVSNLKAQQNTGKQNSSSISPAAAKNRANNLNKVRALATLSKGKGRVKAGDSKLAQAQVKLESMKASGKYTPEQIKQKESVLTIYQEHLVRLKKSVNKGNSQIKN